MAGMSSFDVELPINCEDWQKDWVGRPLESPVAWSLHSIASSFIVYHKSETSMLRKHSMKISGDFKKIMVNEETLNEIFGKNFTKKTR